MLFKTVTYENALKKKVTKELFFNMNGIEQLELESRYLNKKFDTMEKFMVHISKEKEYSQIVEIIKDIVLTAYGIPDEDEKSPTYGELLKTPEIKEKFENSFAYAEVVADLFKNQNALLEFVKGVQYKGSRSEEDMIN